MLKKAISLSLTLGMIISCATIVLPEKLTISKAEEVNQTIYLVENDTNPTTGETGTQPTDEIVFDRYNNSIVSDLGVSKKINVIKLMDSDEFSRINRESITLWSSIDNKTYTEVEDYKLFKNGKDWYLYDFITESRYIKVHYNHYLPDDADFKTTLQNSIKPYYEEIFGNGKGKTKSVDVNLKNKSDVNFLDERASISKTEYGITGENAAIRVYQNGKLLFHYVEGDNIIVRVPEIKAREEQTLTVKYGTTDAMDISNKESVYEITYGTRESFLHNIENFWTDTRGVNYWVHTIPQGTKFPNGATAERETMLSFCQGDEDGKLLIIRCSYDGGRTWDQYGEIGEELCSQINGTTDFVSGGWFVDNTTGRLFFHKHIGYVDEYKKAVIYSDDGGKNWQLADIFDNPIVNGEEYVRACNYSDPIALSCFDGAGQNVDFVMPVCWNKTSEFGWDPIVLVAYSKDGGFTWQHSTTALKYQGEMDYENGMSEANILENDEGKLVLLSRCQFPNVNKYATAYSYDFGLTWTDKATKEEWEEVKDTQGNIINCPLSNVYSPNNEPSTFLYDGNPMLMWGGNNALGGRSYKRNPLSVATSNDNLKSFENIQNLFFETQMEEYNGKTHYITNQNHAPIGANSMYIIFQRLMHKDIMSMRVNNFKDWFYKTKGGYDDFENGSPAADGWTKVLEKEILTSDKKFSTGKYSLYTPRNTIATRTIPYLKNGRISFDVFVGSGTYGIYELQPALAQVNKTCGLLTLQISNKMLVFGNNMAQLKDGWNNIAIDLDLNKSSQATVKINRTDNYTTELKSEVGAYVCNLTIFSNADIYTDNVVIDAGNPIAIDALTTKKSSVIWWIIGGSAVVLLIVTGVAIFTKKQKKCFKKSKK